MLYRMLLVGLLVFSFLGCTPPPNPGTWDQARVETKIKESLELTEISLEPASDGSYTGSGKKATGESYKLTVTQDPKLKRLSWKFDSDRGDVGENFYEFVSAQ